MNHTTKFLQKGLALLLILGSTTAFAQMPGSSASTSTSSGSATGYWTISDGGTYTKDTTITGVSTLNESAIYITKGTLNLNNSTISTTASATSTGNYEAASFYGWAAGILVEGSSSKATIRGTKITTTGAGANGVFAYNASSIYLYNDSILCSDQFAHGVDATYGGSITIDTLYIYTTGGNGGAAAIATDRGSGTIVGNHINATTTGDGSPAIYSTGKISVSNSKLTALTSEALVIEGENNIILTNDTLSSTASGRGTLVVQSQSGDAEGDSAVIQMTNSIFTYAPSDNDTAAMFFASNGHGYITLTGTTLDNSSDTLFKAAANRWGTSGSNGGYFDIEFNASSGTGAITCDAISGISVDLNTGSTWTGSFNPTNTACATTMAIDTSSVWSLDADSYVDTLTDTETDFCNIESKGHSVYYGAAANKSSSACYALYGGGYVVKEGSTCSSTTTCSKPTTGIKAASVKYASSAITFQGGMMTANRTVHVEVSDISGRTVISTTLARGETLALPQKAGVYAVRYEGQSKLIKNF